MREIKFRAWAYGERQNHFVYFELFQGVNNHTPLIYPEADLHDWQQFTGLKDKTGRDIYEGDVLLVPDTFTETVDVGVGTVPVARWPENHLSEVVFEDGCFKIVIREKGDIWWKVHYNFECVKEETGLEALEVIGNIYESPELLAARKE